MEQIPKETSSLASVLEEINKCSERTERRDVENKQEAERTSHPKVKRKKANGAIEEVRGENGRRTGGRRK